MANLKVSIVVRTTDSNGNRSWVPATGKNDPAGPLKTVTNGLAICALFLCRVVIVEL